MNNMLTIEEVKSFLEIEQGELEKYLEQGKLRSYKIGGTYVRFRKEDVINLRFEIQPSITRLPKRISLWGSIREFWRFNNFYIISMLVVIGLVAYFVRS